MPAKPHVPTQRKRGVVEGMAAVGTSEADIAKYIGINAQTLRRRYRTVLDKAHIGMIARVSGALFNNAIEGKNVAAQIFIMKTRAGWKEPAQDHHHTGAVGSYDLSKVSDADLKRLHSILSPAVVSSGGGGTSTA